MVYNSGEINLRQVAIFKVFLRDGVEDFWDEPLLLAYAMAMEEVAVELRQRAVKLHDSHGT